jgi:hypothetical protein
MNYDKTNKPHLKPRLYTSTIHRTLKNILSGDHVPQGRVKYYN